MQCKWSRVWWVQPGRVGYGRNGHGREVYGRIRTEQGNVGKSGEG